MSASNLREGCLFRAPNGTELVVITLDCGSARIEGSLSALVLKYRYLMFTQNKLYTLDPECYENGNYVKKNLIVNTIDMEFFSHIVLISSSYFHEDQFMNINKSQYFNLKDQYK